MQYTIRVVETKHESTIKAFVSLCFEDSFLITGIRIVEYVDKSNIKHLFVAMPNKKHNNTYKDVCFPTNMKFRNELTNNILKEYYKVINEKKKNEGDINV